ncbi:MAG: hypothetical protein ACP5HK_04195 [Acidilobus sp.]
MYGYWEEIAIAAAMGVEHATEPDHIVAMRLIKPRSDMLRFGLLHGVGFLLLSVPLALAVIEVGLKLDYIDVVEVVGDLVGIGFAALLLYSSLMDKEIEISAGGSGLAQGALSVTPSKLLVLIMAITSGVYEGTIVLLTFTIASSAVMPVIGVLASKVPTNLTRALDVTLGAAALLFFLTLILRIRIL